MRYRIIPFAFVVSGLLLAFTLAFPASRVVAQCGSESSTCRDCHEVQSQAPVNNDGTGWHESHAFGDFCYICHAGNQQASSPEAAHEGMVPPLSDLKASCQACHPSDLDERAAVYTAILGVDPGGADTEALATLVTTPLDDPLPATLSATEQSAAIAIPASTPAAECAPFDTQIVVDDPNLIDYVQHYNQVVLGEQPINWGDIVLASAIGLLVLGGGGFVVFNEMRLRQERVVKIEGEYPADVVEMLPALTNLRVQSRNALKRILNNREQSDRVLNLIDAVVTDEERKE